MITSDYRQTDRLEFFFICTIVEVSLWDDLITTVFVEQPLALTGSGILGLMV